MPVKVISLLSSSEAGSPPLQRARQPSPPGPKAQENRRVGSDNILASALPRNQSVNSGRPIPNRRPEVQISSDDVWLVSDDDVGPSEKAHEDESVIIEEPAQKRRKLHPNGANVGSPNGVSARSTAAVPLRACGLNRSNATALSRLELAEPRRQWIEDEDPLVSSSSRVTEKPPRRAHDQVATLPSHDLDDDPFASSPAQLQRHEHLKTGSRLAVLDDIDPFASSSPGQVQRPADSAQLTAAWDPISSSAPLPASTDDGFGRPSRSLRRSQSEVVLLEDSDDDCGVQTVSDDDFPDIAGLAASKRKFDAFIKTSAESAAVKQLRTLTSAETKADQAGCKRTSLEKAKEKEEKAAAREAEKERKRLQREREKEEKAREKARAAALAEVNKIRTGKKVSTPEMIVDLPITLEETLKEQVKTLLRDLDVEFASWTSPVENVIKWRRKVCSRYNDEEGHWEPVPERIEQENYAMVLVSAAQFVGLVLGKDEDASLEYHVMRMKDHFPNDTIIYLIEGLELWLRKNRGVRNREFVTAVRGGLEPLEGDQQPPSSTQQQRKRKAAATPTYVDEEIVETSLLQLQILHGVLIHHTAIPLETARWIAVFTQHISTVPYRRQRDAANDAGFCMESGQVRTGDGPRDTYVRMLQEIGRVTVPIAYGIAAEFETVPKLVRGLEDGGPLSLEKVRKSVNKDGEASDRTVGQAVSRRIFKIFLGRDEASTDI
ncbi:hypothetical protein MYCTH_56445 [Thermothelomyces thermophilus ATCC 42464]|uniref:ERCC4 domain-containing protein n=1 Tax=Thermothelomyces thermophilus (strain ATCC 42464 / BCRC 31852 / DSM 1799) TaxID=573729 RepID=G2QQ75_THET4|nr:uncharacterized protein MYCTH_56445 [Thermothelomyces thermophilus ATCC 42464]AEO61738.1 hypothetical protein MYCTH_56445 [Thermothelomyces thermophilus ATCC 42464]